MTHQWLPCERACARAGRISLALGLLLVLGQYSFAASRVLGDFNGDFFEDLAIGVPREDAGAINAAGAVNVLYGSATGLQATGVGGPEDQIWDQDTAGVRGDAGAEDEFGEALAVGDFNGDGYHDLAVGVPNEDTGAVSAGAVNVLYGSDTGLQATGAGGPDDQYWHQDSPGVQGTAEIQDSFGRALSVGDFNGDGYDDLAIGVVDEDVGGIVRAGAVNVLYGSETGLQATGAGGPDDQSWHQDSPGVQGTAEIQDFFGRALSVGDFNGDGYDDLAIGVVDEDVGGIVAAGAVNVLYGSETGLQATGAGGPDDQLWHQDSAGVQGTAEANDRFGMPLAAGDFNGDGNDDLAIGVPDEDVGGIVQAGAVNVLYGSETGLQATGAGGPDDQLWDQDSFGVADVAEERDGFGLDLSAGDFNGDNNTDDLAIGVTLEDFGSIDDAGAVHVLYGSTTGLQATGTGGPNDQLWYQDSAGVEGMAEDGDRFGWALCAGDFNGDTLDDLAVGVPEEDVGSINSAGSVNVLYGSAPAGLQATGVGGPDDQLWHQDSVDVKGQAEERDDFGHAFPQGGPIEVIFPARLTSTPEEHASAAAGRGTPEEAPSSK